MIRWAVDCPYLSPCAIPVRTGSVQQPGRWCHRLLFLNMTIYLWCSLHAFWIVSESQCTLETSLLNPMDSIARVSSPAPQVKRAHFNGRLSLSFLDLGQVSWPNNSCQWCRRYWLTNSSCAIQTLYDWQHWTLGYGFCIGSSFSQLGYNYEPLILVRILRQQLQ